MPDRIRDHDGRRSNADTGNDVRELLAILRSGAPQLTRRDLLRTTAIAGGAVAMAKTGSTIAAPATGGRQRFSLQDADVETDVTLTVPFDPYGQPVTLDPHRTVNWGPFWVMFPNVWAGLLRYDENGKVELELASDYTVSDNGLVYTFTIREDAAFATGNAVTADDCVASWQRALDPAALSPMADFMSLVDGYRRYIAGQSDEIGFRAVDQSTVEVQISKPFTYFPSLMASFVWAVVDVAALDEYGDDFVLNDGGAGPWRFTEYDPSTQLVMEPNEHYYGGTSPSITRIEWPFLTGPEAAQAALDMYLEDEAISADVPTSLLETVSSDETLASELIRIEPEGNVTAIGMDFRQPPFDDVRIRRAIAQSIDKDEVANTIWDGTWVPATSFTPPVLGVIANYEAPEGLPFDPDAARAQLADAGYENGEGLPAIVYRQPAEESDVEKGRASALLAMIEQNSGIVIQHDTTMSRQQIADLDVDNGGRQFDIIGWWNLWETPHILNEVCSPDSQYMRGVFNWDDDLEPTGDYDPGAAADEFEELADDADLEQDEAERNALFQQAEQLLLEHAVYVPLGYWVQSFLQKPYIEGTRQGPWTGRFPALFDANVVVRSREES
jgi:oligopeptide transport system substrate-binding protein